jgi:hypothetical protein
VPWKLRASLFLALVLHAGQPPVKLNVEANPRSINAGASVSLRVNLLETANHPAPAPKLLKVMLQARLPSGKVNSLGTVDLAAGASSAQVSVKPPGSGLVYLWAKQPELLPGGAFVQIRPAAVAPPPPDQEKSAQGKKPAGIQPPATGSGNFDVPTIPAHALPRVTLRYSPDRAFLADGKDAVAIDAFLVNGEGAAAGDIRLNVFDGSGTLQPLPMVIPRGQIQGRSVLTSNHPGVFTVEYLGSAPAAEFDGEKKLSIHFVPPVTRLVLTASPPAISLVDTADLVARLTDEHGLSIATDAPRQVTFTIEAGQGGIQHKEVQIPAGQFEARTTFQPEWLGEVRVAASTANLITATAPVRVATPFALLTCSALGGIAGGVLSRKKRHKPDRWRALIGLATGFLFYWACIFLGLASIARGVVLNPASALALSAIGGWLQTEVFTTLWSAIKPKAAA